MLKLNGKQRLFLCLAIALGVFSFLNLALSGDVNVIVNRVIDGDTFETTHGDKVRLIGVDTPESLDPNKPVEYFAAEAKGFLDSVIGEQKVRLEFGPERTDKYNRFLCYVWINDTVLVNQEIIAHGFGMAYLRFPHKLENQFLQSELAARRAAIGMWASPRAATYKVDVSKYVIPETKLNLTNETVYITRTGAKYHRGSCNYLRKSAIPISKEDAISRGYTPCSKCNP